jgi:hypothetical protein
MIENPNSAYQLEINPVVAYDCGGVISRIVYYCSVQEFLVPSKGNRCHRSRIVTS